MNQSKENKTGAILLAAGLSSRFGASKLLAELDSGTTVFAQTYSRLKLAVDDVLVVTRPDIARQLMTICPELLIFDNAQDGMGATLAFAIKNTSSWDSALICLADMPFISTATYKDIAAASDAKSIVIPIYEGKKANPVSFGSHFFSELQNLSGDTGGRELLKRHPDSIRSLRVSEHAVLDDIDTPADLVRLQS
ncbi:MAG: molybdenum cofactor cytidylyltransferase [Pseudohongiellaceae bacterium]|jgi:molybdenum cofactor cytidylyltransferase